MSEDSDETVGSTEAATEALLEAAEGPGDGARGRAREPELPTNYRLVQRLGEGGMGEVWEAEQLEPIRRRVAIKLIQRGIDSRQILARFDSEGQALALMDHPFIAKIFDAGETPTGRPYFVMELIQGLPLTEFCDREKLSTRARLQLVRRVCAGVQHAHQKAIIHRDLKPSNVLVAYDGDEPVPKIIDFGIAKAVNQPLTDKTLFTRLGQLVGTPEYMSPEQAEGGLERVDTRSDVYSLGVLLYEVLVGALPFEPSKLRAEGLEAIHRIIREVDPPKPSTRVSSLGGSEVEVAAARSTDVSQLRSTLTGDLDWITMKALDKNPSRRYDSPSDLAEDLGRYLEDLPVEASPPSLLYRSRKFLRRHRWFAATATLVAMSLVVGGAMALYGLLEARRSAEVARQEATKAETVSEFLLSLFEQADPDKTRGEDLRVREVVDAGVARIRTEEDMPPASRASMLETLGRVNAALGRYDVARPLAEEALETFESEQALGRVSAGDVSRSRARLAHVVGWQGEYEEAARIASLAVSELDELSTRLDSDDEAGRRRLDLEVASALNVLGVAQANLMRLDDALESHRRALRLRESWHAPDAHDEIGQSVHNLAIVHYFSDDLDRAAELYERSLRIEERVSGAETPGYATSLHTLAIARQAQGRLEEAQTLEERSYQIRVRTLGAEHPHVSFSLMTLGDLSSERGDHRSAIDFYRRSVAVGTKAWSPTYPEVVVVRRELARATRADRRSCLVPRRVPATPEGSRTRRRGRSPVPPENARRSCPDSGRSGAGP